MEIVNCKKCGKLFQRITSTKICPACERALEEKFTEVREYIRDNPDVTIMEVSREMEVSVEQIKQWVREERLLFTEASGSGIQCVMCGVPITTGKYCAKCKMEVAHTLESAYDKPKITLAQPQITGSAKGKMRYIGHEDNKK